MVVYYQEVGGWEILACVPEETSTTYLAPREKYNPPSVTQTHIIWLLPRSMQIVRSLEEQFKVKYDMGRGVRGSPPPEKILSIGIKKVPFEQEKTATPPLGI